MSSSIRPSRPARRIGLFGKVAFACAMISLLSVGLSTLLFQRQVQKTTEVPLHTEGETLLHVLSGLLLEKLNDETTLVLRCQALCRPGSNVTYIAFQPRNGEAMIFQPHQWSLTALPLPQLVQSGTGPVRMDDPWTGEEVLVFSRDLEMAGVPWGRIQFGLSLQKSRMAMQESLRNLGLTAALGSLLVVAGAFMTARRISQPISDLSDLARKLAGGDLSARAALPPGDEIGDLADSMNLMATGIDQRNTELRQRVCRERELGRISSTFLSVDPADMDDTFSSALKALVQQFGVEAGALFLFTPDRQWLERTWAWHEPGTLAPEESQYAPALWPWFMEQLEKHQILTIHAGDDLPSGAAAEQAFMAQHGLSSLAAAAVGPPGQPGGLLILHSRQPAHRWQPEDVDYLLMAAVTLANALAHRGAARDRSRLHSQLLQAQKMEAVGKLSGGIAHDFNNMLVPIMGYSDSLLNSLPADSPCLHEIQEIKRAAESAAALTRQLLTFSRKQIISRQEINLNELVLTLRHMLRRLIGENINLTTSLTADAWTVLADTGQVEQCLVNLCVNARHAIPDRGTITLITEMVEHPGDPLSGPAQSRPAGLYLRLSVRDSGCGMDEETLTRIFEPFYSTKGAEGTGLGLSVVHGVMEQHSGWISVESTPDAGSTFHMYFPALHKPIVPSITRTSPVQAAPPVPRGTGQHILLIEDESGVLAFVSSALRQHGYHVTTADTGAAARQLFLDHGHRYDLVMSDVVLPDASGIELLDEFYTLRPDLRAMLSSGYSEKSALVEMVSARGIQFLHKPYILTELLRSIHQALTESPSAVVA